MYQKCLKFCLAEIWHLYDREGSERLRDNVNNVEENCKIRGEKRKMEYELRFFKLDFAKMVGDKEEALTELGNARLVINDLKEELQKKKMADHEATNIYQLLRAKAEKERDKLKEEKKELQSMIAELLKEKEATKCKVRKIKEACQELD